MYISFVTFKWLRIPCGPGHYLPYNETQHGAYDTLGWKADPTQGVKSDFLHIALIEGDAPFACIAWRNTPRVQFDPVTYCAGALLKIFAQPNLKDESTKDNVQGLIALLGCW